MADQDNQKLFVDSDWKQQARAEKEKLAKKRAEEAAAKAAASPTADEPGVARSKQRQTPEASFKTLMTSFAHRALLFMGAVPDPQTGQRIQSLDAARHQIDLLTVLLDKTQGNLTQDEQQQLSLTLFELRQSYIQISEAMRRKNQQRAG